MKTSSALSRSSIFLCVLKFTALSYIFAYLLKNSGNYEISRIYSRKVRSLGFI